MKMKQWLCASLLSFLAGAGLVQAGYPQVIQVQAPAEAAPAPAAPPKVMPQATQPAQPIVIAPNGSYDCTSCSSCSSCFQDDCGGCGPRMWFGADYLLWWVKNGPLPTPLVTTGPAGAGAAFPDAGAIGTPGTAVLLGGADIDYGELHGARLTVGAALRGNVGVEVSGFFLGRTTYNADLASSATTALFTPLNVVGVGEVGVPIGLPAGAFGLGILPALPGTVNFSSSTELWGAEANAVWGVGGRFQVLAGFRYLDLQEDAQMTAVLSTPPLGGLIGGLPLGALSLATFDNFATRNQFYGVNLGGKVSFGSDALSADIIGKVALGTMQQRVSANGSLALGLPVGGVPLAITAPGGRFVQSTNGGSFDKDDFCAVPELEIRVGYRVTSWLRATIGYNILYISDVVRPGEQIDRTLSLGSVPVIQAIQAFGPLGGLGGPGSPVMPLESTDFWAQGVNFGLHASW